MTKSPSAEERRLEGATSHDHERLFRALVERAPDVIARIDRELRHVYVNSAVVDATGLTPEEITGRRTAGVGVPLELCTRWAAAARRVFATAREVNIDIEYSTPRGQRYFESRMVPELDAAGEVESVLAIARDVTARREVELALRASEARCEHAREAFLALAEALPVVVTRCDAKLRLTYANAGFAQLTGTPGLDCVGATCAQAGLAPAVAAQWDRAARRALESGEAVEFEFEAGDTGRLYEARAVPLRGAGGMEGVICVAHHGSEPRRADSERVEALEKQRDVFVREVHHRVKNNLQGIVGLLRQHANSNADLVPFFEKAISQLLAMATVHDLRGREAGDGVCLEHMVQEVAASVERTTGTPITLDTTRGSADPELRDNEAVAVALVLNELIVNAAKHSSRDTAERTVWISSRMAGNRAEIAIVNHGGLPPGFDFARGERLGTGLELVKALLPANGASILYAANEGYVRAVLEIVPPVLVKPAD